MITNPIKSIPVATVCNTVYDFILIKKIKIDFMKIKILITILILLTPQISQAKNQWSTGIGYQYGGLLGGQYGYIDGDNKYFISLGLVGGAIGYERVVSENSKHTVGIMTGAAEEVAQDGFLLLIYNYHFSTLQDNGWLAGINIGIRREDDSGLFAQKSDIGTYSSLGITVAYKF